MKKEFIMKFQRSLILCMAIVLASMFVLLHISDYGLFNNLFYCLGYNISVLVLWVLLAASRCITRKMDDKINSIFEVIIAVELFFIMYVQLRVCYDDGEYFVAFPIIASLLSIVWLVISNRIAIDKIFTIFIISFAALIAVSVAEYNFVVLSGDKENTKHFGSEENYKRFKKLYNKGNVDSYIIVQYTDSTLVLRNIRSDEESIKTFSSPVDYEDFILYNTMGKGVYLPVIGDDCEFNDSDCSVKFIVKEKAVEKEVRLKSNHIFYFSIWIGIMIVFGSFMILFSKEKAKESVINGKLVNE